MSLIMEALKKSEQERQRREAGRERPLPPKAPEPPERKPIGWPVLAAGGFGAGLLLAGFVFGLWTYLEQAQQQPVAEAPPVVQPEEPPTPAAQAVALPPPKPVAQPQPVPEAAPEAAAPVADAAPEPVAEAPVALPKVVEDLREQEQKTGSVPAGAAKVAQPMQQGDPEKIADLPQIKSLDELMAMAKTAPRPEPQPAPKPVEKVASVEPAKPAPLPPAQTVTQPKAQVVPTPPPVTETPQPAPQPIAQVPARVLYPEPEAPVGPFASTQKVVEDKRPKLDSAVAYYRRAWYHEGRDEDDLALKDYSQAILMMPKFGAAYIGRAWTYEKKNDWDHAVDDYSRAITLSPNDPAPLISRGYLRFYRGDWNGARQDFMAAYNRGDDTMQRYALLWQYLAGQRGGVNTARRDLAIGAQKVGLGKWPGAIIRLYLDDADQQIVLNAAHQAADNKIMEYLCVAYFFLGQKALIDGDQRAARTWFNKTIETGVTSFRQYMGAKEELRRLDRS